MTRSPFSSLCIKPLATFCAALVLTSATWAQDKPEPPTKAELCTPVYEMIVPLRPPVFGGSVLWRRVQGVEGEDRFVDLAPVGNTALLVGETRAFQQGKSKPDDPVFFLTSVDGSGKILWEKRIPDKNLKEVQAVAALDKKIVILNEVRDGENGSATRLTFFNESGDKTAEKIIRSDAYKFIPRDIVADPDTDQFIVAIWAVNRENEDDNYTILARTSANGDVVWKRQYLPGVPNRLETLYRMRNGQIAAAGRVQVEEGRDAGWFLLTTDEGDIIGQTPFKRGYSALLRKALETPDGGFLLVGDSLPLAGGLKAAWIMKVTNVGTPVWQRFITGKYSYAAMDSIIYPDGRINVLMSGKPAEDGGREHARILTYSNEGLILNDEAYIENSNSFGVKFMPVENGRFMVGLAQTGFAEYGVAETMRLTTYDAWATGLQRLPPYDDPCGVSKRGTLDDENQP